MACTSNPTTGCTDASIVAEIKIQTNTIITHLDEVKVAIQNLEASEEACCEETNANLDSIETKLDTLISNSSVCCESTSILFGQMIALLQRLADCECPTTTTTSSTTTICIPCPPTTTTTTLPVTTTTTTVPVTTTTTTDGGQQGGTTTTTTTGTPVTTTTTTVLKDCYELTIPAEAKTSGEDDLYIGYEPFEGALVNQIWSAYDDQDLGEDLQIFLCSRSAPTFWYGGMSEAHPTWITNTCSECCSEDADCIPTTTTTTAAVTTTTTTAVVTTTTTTAAVTTTTTTAEVTTTTTTVPD